MCTGLITLEDLCGLSEGGSFNLQGLRRKYVLPSSLDFLKFNFAFALMDRSLNCFQFDNIRGHSSKHKHSKKRSGDDRAACTHELCYSSHLLDQAQ